MAQILCSTGALIGRPNGRDFTLLKAFVPQLDCDGFEFMMYDSWYDKTEALLATLQELPCSFPVMHCEKSIGELLSLPGEENLSEAKHRFSVNCQIAQKIGANKMVLHLWNGILSDAHFENNLSRLGELLKMAEGYGITLLIENVVCNHHTPMAHWKALAKVYPQLSFIFDTKMAAFHGELEQLYLPENAYLWERILHYHVNDYAGGFKDWKNLRTLPIGQGNIDFDAFFAYIKKIGYQGSFTVEATAFDQSGAVDIAMLNRQFALMRDRLLG